MKKWILTKSVSMMTVYFKDRDRTGHVNTSMIDCAMTFPTKDLAIEYNRKWLYSEYDYIEIEL